VAAPATWARALSCGATRRLAGAVGVRNCLRRVHAASFERKGLQVDLLQALAFQPEALQQVAQHLAR
jgi:hypothetical protein